MDETKKDIKEPRVINDDMEILSLLKSLQNTKEKLWCWQARKEGDDRRPVHYSRIKKVDPIQKFVQLEPTNSLGYKFFPDRDVFIFSSDRSVAIKISIKEFDPHFMLIPYPKRINQLQNDFLQNVELVEKENEEKNLHKRAAPRKTAGENQMITVQRVLETDQHSPTQIFRLYDISAGGMGFQVEDPAEFAAGDKVKAISIDGNPLPRELLGEVKSVRQMEDDVFKIGVMFIKD